jgi:hypothetical protein
MTTVDLMIPAAGVKTPDFDLGAVREIDPVAGYAPKQELVVLLAQINLVVINRTKR